VAPLKKRFESDQGRLKPGMFDGTMNDKSRAVQRCTISESLGDFSAVTTGTTHTWTGTADSVSALSLMYYGNIQPGLVSGPVTNVPFSNANVPAGSSTLVARTTVGNGNGMCTRVANTAKGYDKYRITSDVVITYQPKNTGESPGGQVGETILYFDPDPIDGVVNTTAALLNEKWKVVGRPCDALKLVLPRSLFRREYFLRGGPVPNTGNIRDYDAGKFYLLHNGLLTTASAQLLGELFVEAEVDLLDAIIIGNATFMQTPPTHNVAVFGLLGPNITAGGNGLPMTLLEPSDFVFDSSGIPMSTGGVTSTINLSPGRYKVGVYANPTFNTTAVGSAVATVTINADTNIVIQDQVGITNLGAVSQTLYFPVHFIGTWHSNSANTTAVTLNWSNVTSGTGTVVYGQIANNYSNNTSGNYNTIGAIIIIEAL